MYLELCRNIEHRPNEKSITIPSSVYGIKKYKWKEIQITRESKSALEENNKIRKDKRYIENRGYKIIKCTFKMELCG